MLHSRLQAFRFAFEGLGYLLRTQTNARIHLAMTAATVVMAAWLHIDREGWVFLVLVIGLVWAAEAFNTALEAVVDLASPESHALAKASKDVAAAGVLLAAATAVVVGLLILGPPLWARLQGGG